MLVIVVSIHIYYVVCAHLYLMWPASTTESGRKFPVNKNSALEFGQRQ